MDSNTELILNHRQLLLDNSDSLYSAYKKKDMAQLSLFDNTPDAVFDLIPKSTPNYNELLIKEKEVLGLCISSNRLLRYRLIKSKICNTDINEIFQLEKSNRKLKFIGELVEIKYMTAKASGNKYAKLFFEDETGKFEFYLFGKDYESNIRSLFLNRVYLIMCSYNSLRGSANVTMVADAESFNIDELIIEIHIIVSSIEDIKGLRKYVYDKMIGNQYNLYFEYKDNKIKAPYKVKITKDIVEELVINGYEIKAI